MKITHTMINSYTAYLQILAKVNLFCALFLVGLFFEAGKLDAMVVRWGETHNVEPYALVDDDLYVLASKSATIQGTTTGDVLIGAMEITQTGAIREDALLIGGIVAVDNATEGDLRILGGRVVASSTVGEDAVVVGNVVIFTEDAVIEGDLLVFGDYVRIDGEVKGKVNIYARTVELHGTFLHNVEVDVKESLSVKGDARIEGELHYSAPREAVISETVSIAGGVAMTQKEFTKSDTKFGTSDMYRVLVAVFVSLLLVLLFPAQTKRMSAIALGEKGFWRVLKGFVVVVFTPFVVVVLIATVIGLLPALILLFSYFTVLLGAIALAPVLAGVVLTQWVKKEESAFTAPWVSLGAILFVIIAYVPLLGGIIQFVLFLMAVHAIVSFTHKGVWKKRKETFSREAVTYPSNEKNNQEGDVKEDEKTTTS